MSKQITTEEIEFIKKLVASGFELTYSKAGKMLNVDPSSLYHTLKEMGIPWKKRISEYRIYIIKPFRFTKQDISLWMLPSWCKKFDKLILCNECVRYELSNECHVNNNSIRGNFAETIGFILLSSKITNEKTN